MRRVVPATEEMIRRFYGAPSAKSWRALAVVDGDEVLGIGGIYLDGPRWVLFSNMREDVQASLKKYRRELLRVCWALLGIASRKKLPVQALADPEIVGSDRLLAHLGFVHIDRGVWQWRG